MLLASVVLVRRASGMEALVVIAGYIGRVLLWFRPTAGQQALAALLQLAAAARGALVGQAPIALLVVLAGTQVLAVTVYQQLTQQGLPDLVAAAVAAKGGMAPQTQLSKLGKAAVVAAGLGFLVRVQMEPQTGAVGQAAPMAAHQAVELRAYTEAVAPTAHQA